MEMVKQHFFMYDLESSNWNNKKNGCLEYQVCILAETSKNSQALKNKGSPTMWKGSSISWLWVKKTEQQSKPLWPFDNRNPENGFV